MRGIGRDDGKGSGDVGGKIKGNRNNWVRHTRYSILKVMISSNKGVIEAWTIDGKMNKSSFGIIPLEAAQQQVVVDILFQVKRRRGGW